METKQNVELRKSRMVDARRREMGEIGSCGIVTNVDNTVLYN